jgi:N-acetylneuraminic acid mutarotase
MSFLTGLQSSSMSGSNTLYVFDDSANGFYALVKNTMIALTYPGPKSNAFYTVSCGYNGKCYFYGDGASGGDLYSYNPVGNVWTALASSPTNSLSYAGFAGTNGYLYVIGGMNAAGNSVNTVQQYNIATNTWTTMGNMPDTCLTSIVANQNTGLIYRLCGDSYTGGSRAGAAQNGYVYDPVSDSWLQLAAFPYTNGLTAISSAILGNYLYIFGGNDNGNSAGVATTYRYDMVNNIYATLSNFPVTPNGGGYVSITLNNKLYIYNAGTANKSIYIYDPVNDLYTLSPTSMVNPFFDSVSGNYVINSSVVGPIPNSLGGA